MVAMQSLEVKMNKVFLGVLFVVCTLCLCNYDLNIICHWSITLLDCFFAGNVRGFIDVCESKAIGFNYRVFTILIIAIWTLPLYLVDKFLRQGFDIIIYMLWLKIFMALVVLKTLFVLRKILIKFSNDTLDVFYSIAIFLLCPVCMLAIVGGGQVDGVGTLFMLLVLYKIIEKEYKKAAFYAILSICVKGWSVMIIVPWILLLWKKENVKNIFYMLGIMGVGLLLNHVLSDVLFPGYNDYFAKFNWKNVDFLGEIFRWKFGEYTSLFFLIVVIVCYVCFFLAEQGKVELYHFILLPFIIEIAFVMLVRWHPQWLMYMVPLLSLMAISFKNKTHFFILCFLFSVGYVISVYAGGGVNFNSNGMMGNCSFIRLLIGIKDFSYNGPWIEDVLKNISSHYISIGRSLMGASLVLLGVFYYKNETHKIHSTEECLLLERISFYIQYLPILFFLVLSICLCTIGFKRILSENEKLEVSSVVYCPLEKNVYFCKGDDVPESALFCTPYVKKGFEIGDYNTMNWAEGDKVVMYYKFSNESFQKKIKATFVLGEIFNKKQKVKVKVNGKKIAAMTLRNGDELTFSFVNKTEDSIIKIEFLLLDAISPAVLGVNGDGRKLAFQINRAFFTMTEGE